MPAPPSQKTGADTSGDTLLDQAAHVIVDAITDADLMKICTAAKGAPLLCGGSGIALGLPRKFGVASAPPGWEAITGLMVVISGSCSGATRVR